MYDGSISNCQKEVVLDKHRAGGRLVFDQNKVIEVMRVMMVVVMG